MLIRPAPTAFDPIGVFDSGVGGLTVLRALRDLMPGESMIYLGDTARLPYGTKSPETVGRYAVQAARLLVERGVKMLVVACNTATAQALPLLRRAFPGLPVLGVVLPGAEAACAASKTGRILVIATESTVRTGAYTQAIHRLRPQAEMVSQACPLFVALAEEGLVTGPIAEGIARHYLEPVLAAAPGTDCLVLGCTHFPVLKETLRVVLGETMALVDSAEPTARAARDELRIRGLLSGESDGRVRYLATDCRERFARVAGIFLGHSLAPESVELVDLTALPEPV